MSKFKVGDRVRFPETYPLESIRGVEATVLALDGDRCKVDSGGSWGISFEVESSLEPIQAAAIRTVTRREIVPGVYGIVETGADGSVSVYKQEPPTVDELREAAHLFNQIAEVLEENARAAA